MTLFKFWRWRLGLGAAALDGIWSLSALSSIHTLAGASTVQLSGLMVWIFLHLPAALLGSLPFSHADPSQPLSSAELSLMGLLAAAQAFALGYALGWRKDKKAAFKTQRKR
jgi:hypothetical protein